uniref:Hyaluronan/mRNA-binding protein domain-containing protein n=2 Tax=Aegilops tauschii subsp. strangulata TaxID=200361 RepID=A0A453MH47_AEGTS
MTLEEYEKMQEKKKSLEASKPEERRVAAVDFEGLQLLEKKKIEDDAKLKAENVRKAKEAAAKEAKPRKVSIQEYLKNEDGSAYVPPTPPRRPQYGGGYRGGRGNGSYNGRSSRDNSSERRVYNSGRGENAIVFHNVEANANDSGASRRGEGYNGERQQGGYQQGGYNGGRGNGRYQERQDGYNGERRDQQQGGYYQERRDAYNGDRREQGGYNTMVVTRSAGMATMATAGSKAGTTVAVAMEVTRSKAGTMLAVARSARMPTTASAGSKAGTTMAGGAMVVTRRARRVVSAGSKAGTTMAAGTSRAATTGSGKVRGQSRTRSSPRPTSRL